MRNMRFVAFFLPVAAFGAACVTPDGCAEWTPVKGGPGRSMVYRTYSLGEKNEKIRRAFVLVHGAGRDADQYFRTAVAAAFLAGALEDTIVVSPRFASKTGSCSDALAENEINWPCTGDSWRSGGVSVSHKELASYDFMDELMRKLANRQVFPNLKAIVLAGHSAGGQFVNRYEMSNKVHDSLGVPVTYVVSNPSSYGYPDKNRPAGADGKEMAAFADESKCRAFNRWPYGFENRGNGYTSAIPDDQLRKNLAARTAVYLLGELDILPLAGFDSSCSAMAQGKTRLARGQAFGKYVVEKYGAKDHKTVVVPLCGHNARCMFTAETTLPIVFPKQ
jgi:hypothetical protein